MIWGDKSGGKDGKGGNDGDGREGERPVPMGCEDEEDWGGTHSPCGKGNANRGEEEDDDK